MSIRNQIRPLLTLALPLILAELGWMSMGIVDTVMIGHMDRPVLAIAASALGQVFYNTVCFGLSGILLSLDTFLSQSHGAGRIDEANRWLQHGLALAVTLSLALVGIVLTVPRLFAFLPIDHAVLAGAVRASCTHSTGAPPALFLYFALRRYLQAFNHVRPIAVALISANLINAAMNWLLIYGHHWSPQAGVSLSIPALGIYGSGLSTALSRLYLAAFMVVAVLVLDRRHNYGLRRTPRLLDLARIRRLAALGAPAGAAIFVEIAIFAAVTFLIGTLGPLPLAGHEIALNCASFTFMIPFAISAAASVRVGQAIGRGDPQQAAAAGWAGIAFGAGVMALMAVLLSVFNHAIAAAFTHDAAIIAATVPLLYVAAAFQFFDGLQITASGALRAQATPTPASSRSSSATGSSASQSAPSSPSVSTSEPSGSGWASAPASSSPASPWPPPGIEPQSPSPPPRPSPPENFHQCTGLSEPCGRAG